MMQLMSAGLSNVEWWQLLKLLCRYAERDLDQFDAWQIDTASGPVFETGAACAVTRVVRCIASDYTSDMREIRWTDRSEDHIAAHNVTPDEVEQVLYARPRLVLKGAEGIEYAFGTTDEGRYLLIVLAESIDGRAYVVTARDMTNAERQAFRRKGR